MDLCQLYNDSRDIFNRCVEMCLDIFKKVLEASGKDIFCLYPALSNVIETLYDTILAIELGVGTLNICIENTVVPLYKSRLNLTVVT